MPKPKKPVRKVSRNEPEFAATQTESVLHKSDKPCSVEFSRDAKGVPRWNIKLYFDLEDGDTTLDEVLRLDERLREETK